MENSILESGLVENSMEKAQWFFQMDKEEKASGEL